MKRRFSSAWTALTIVLAALTFAVAVKLHSPPKSPWKPSKVSPWSGPKLNRNGMRNLKLFFLFGVLSLETGSELFVRMPQQWLYGSAPVAITGRQEGQSVVVIFPGAGGPDVHTENLKNKIVLSDRSHRVNRFVSVYDWRKWRGNFIRASFDGQAVGRAICTQLAHDEQQLGQIKHLHAVGVSVGAFAADSCIKAYKKESSNPGTTRVTFLDPFTSKGIFGYGWGLANFGKGADIAEDYLNRDDGVPTTNDPLQQAFTIDVTDAPEKKRFEMIPGESFHSWPVEYLALKWKTETTPKGDIQEPTIDMEPPGKVISIHS